MSNRYKANKRTYYLNLRSNDAIITQTAAGNNLKFEWNGIKNINISRQARICVTSIYFEEPGNANPNFPIVIRSHQVNNSTSYDSGNGAATIIHISNMLHIPTIENWFQLNDQYLTRIELYLSNSVANINNGISANMIFYVQLKIEDYDIEQVDPKLMPGYTKESLAFHYGLNV